METGALSLILLIYFLPDKYNIWWINLLLAFLPFLVIYVLRQLIGAKHGHFECDAERRL